MQKNVDENFKSAFTKPQYSLSAKQHAGNSNNKRRKLSLLKLMSRIKFSFEIDPVTRSIAPTLEFPQLLSSSVFSVHFFIDKNILKRKTKKTRKNARPNVNRYLALSGGKPCFTRPLIIFHGPSYIPLLRIIKHVFVPRITSTSFSALLSPKGTIFTT